jgi:UDP-arabinose 4-epimerase
MSGNADAILVTGGAGYIGSHVCKALAIAGFLPVTLDDLSRGYAWAVKWGPLERGSVGDEGRVLEVVRRHKPVAAIHLAGFTYVGESVERPDLYYENNVAGTVHLLNTLLAQGVRRVIFSSSAAVYGFPDECPVTENHRLAPISPYGFTKVAIEQVLSDLDRAFGFRSISLRYFNAAGGDPEGEIGEAHDPETHLIPRLLYAVSSPGPPVSLFGEDYDTPDGTCIRDYIHVSDLATAHVLALKRLLEGAPSGFYNLGNGSGFSVREVVRAVEDATGRAVPVIAAPRRAGDPARLVSDSGRIRAELGWVPALPELRPIVETAWRWVTGGLAELPKEFRRTDS